MQLFEPMYESLHYRETILNRFFYAKRQNKNFFEAWVQKSCFYKNFLLLKKLVFYDFLFFILFLFLLFMLFLEYIHPSTS